MADDSAERLKAAKDRLEEMERMIRRHTHSPVASDGAKRSEWRSPDHADKWTHGDRSNVTPAKKRA